MIQRLRRKFVVIMMAVVTVLLFTIFATMYYFTKMSYIQKSSDLMHSVMMENRGPDKPHPRREALSLLVADKDPDGQLFIIKNRFSDITDEEAAELVMEADQRMQPSGMILSRKLRYLTEKRLKDQKIRYVFADASAELNALNWQLFYSAIIGAGAMAAFFLLSVLLARWITRPVEDAWNHQRQFIADASHELKTPLTVILSNAAMIASSGELSGEKNQKRMGHIQAETQRMQKLTESLLALARSDSKREAMEQKTLDFSYLVSSRVMVFEPLIFEKEKELFYEIQEKLLVTGDEKNLRQLIDILIDNACKYSNENSRIELSLSKKGEKRLLFSITSEGKPLSEEEQRQIFLRFYRANPSRSGVSGYGLGLSIAQMIVKEHKGNIWVHSDGISKNIFYIDLPLRQA